MDILESRLYTSWTNIIRGPGSASTIDLEKNAMVLVKTIKPEGLNPGELPGSISQSNNLNRRSADPALVESHGDREGRVAHSLLP